jgi:hypothetical protein
VISAPYPVNAWYRVASVVGKTASTSTRAASRPGGLTFTHGALLRSGVSRQ